MKDEDINQFITAINAINERLKVVERKLGIEAPGDKPVSEHKPHLPKVVDKSPQHAPTPIQAFEPKARSGQFLGTIGVFFFVLAASFFIKLAIDSGWLTPERQLGGAILFGIALIGVGFQLKASDAPYSSLLPAGGVIVLFMSSYAGDLYYDLYGPGVASFAVALIAFFSIYLFLKFHHEFFLVISVIGTYLVPLFMYRNSIPTEKVCLYFLVWAALYSVLAISLQRRLLIALTAYLAIGVFQIYLGVDSRGIHGQLELGIWFQAVQFLIFGIAVGVFSVKRDLPLTTAESWGLLPVMLFFYTVEYAMLQDYAPASAPWIALLFAVVIYVIYFIAKRILNMGSLESSPMVATFVGVVLFHSIYLELLPDRYSAWFGVVMLALLYFLKSTRFSYVRFWPCYFLIYGVILSEYFQILSLAGNHMTYEMSALNLVYFAALFFAYNARANKDGSFLLLLFAMLQAMAGLNRISELLTAGPTDMYLTSGLWATLAFVLLFLAYNVRDQILARSSVLLFGIVAIKVLFNDISSSAPIQRIVSLVVIGAMLYAGGMLMRKINSWNQEA